MAVITIGTVKSMREPESFGVTPDDRQELIKCINGVFVADGGYYTDGDIIALTAVFKPSAWEVIKTYWQKRTKVTVIDVHGTTMTNMRVVIKKHEYVKKHNICNVNLELWRV